MSQKWSPICERMYRVVSEAQAKICNALELQDTVKFQKDEWKRPLGGGGLTMVIQDGDVFEKGGVNVSKVFGKLEGQEIDLFGMLLKKQGIDVSQEDDVHFFATGISLVIHPKNPFVPTTL